MVHKLAAWVALAAVIAVTGGCNTIQGIGQDVQAGGRAIEKAAKK